MMNIYLVRHGETVYNIQRIIQGWCDSPLTEEGIKQARKLKEYLKDYEFKAIFTSSLNRAADTARILNEDRNIHFEICDELKEMHFGSLEKTPGNDEFLNQFYEGYKKYGGENSEEAGKRIMDFVLSKYEEYKDDTILIFSHGWSIRSFLRLIDKKRLDDFFLSGGWCANCSLSLVKYDGKDFEIIDVFKDVIA